MGEACNTHEISEISTVLIGKLEGKNRLKDLHMWEDMIKMGIKQDESEMDVSGSGCGQVTNCREFSIEHLVSVCGVEFVEWVDDC